MLTRPQVQRYASQSGLRDLAIAETEIVLTYLLELLGERGFLDKLCITNFGFLAGLSEDEAKLASDPYCREHALWERLRTELPA